MITPLGPTTAARRQTTCDRVTEQLAAWGDPHAAGHAPQLLDLFADLGWALPRALDDPPPPATGSTPEGRAAARALFEQTRAGATQRD